VKRRSVPSAFAAPPRESVALRAGRAAGLARAALAVVAMCALTGGGCLGEPEIEDRWTRVDFESSNVSAWQPLPAGSNQTFSVSAAITYRSIITGYAVTELRASSIRPAEVPVAPDADREPMAYAIDNILANSVSMGRATRAITGWDHLIQRIDFNFIGSVPAGVDSTGSPPGLFLITYLAEGEEIEVQGGMDSLVITPFPSAPYEILPVGMPLTVAAPVAP
jgi:hypothetical protein